MSRRHHLPQLWALVLAGTTLTASCAARAEDPMPVRSEDRRAFARVASACAAASKGNPLTSGEAESLGAGIAATLHSHTRRIGGRDVLDRKVSHFVEAGEQLLTPSEREQHLRTCPVCHAFVRELLAATTIRPVDLELCFREVSIPSTGDEAIRYEVDGNGDLHYIDSEKGSMGFPVAQLAYEAGAWYATDGLHWDGPVPVLRNDGNHHSRAR